MIVSIRSLLVVLGLTLPTAFAQTAAPDPPEVNYDARSGRLEANRGGKALWQDQLAIGTSVQFANGKLYHTAGTTVLERDLETGRPSARVFLSGPVAQLEAQNTGSTSGDLRAIVKHDVSGTTVEETFNLRDGKPLERVVFPPSKALVMTLETGANGQALSKDANGLPVVTNPDPTNPLSLLAAGVALERSGKTIDAGKTFDALLNRSAPFYAWIRVAEGFERLRRPELADKALGNARSAWAAAGYDPGFSVGREAMAAWGNPLEVSRSLFRSGDAVRGGAWLSFLRETMPRFAGHDAVYAEYATWLESQNRLGEAENWRVFSRDLASGSILRWGEQALPKLSGLALAAAAALALAYLALQLVLAAKYWSVQSRDLKPIGGRWGGWRRAPFARLRFSLPTYHTLTERLVLITLLAALIAALIVRGWAERGDLALRDPALRSGTVGGAVFWSKYGNQPNTPGGNALRGLAWQLDGNPEKALEAYRSAPTIPWAINNQGVISASRGDTADANMKYREALTKKSELDAAAFNLGSKPNGDRVTFHNAFRAGQPMLAAPDDRERLEAVVGDFGTEFTRLYRDPITYAQDLPLNLQPWASIALAVLLAVVALGSLIWLLVPRPTSARLAPRGFLYELLAILVPGSGLADEVWGVMLLVPWAALGLFWLARFFNWTTLAPALFGSSSTLGIANTQPWLTLPNLATWLLVAIGAIYAVNFIGWVLEFFAWRRRLRVAAGKP